MPSFRFSMRLALAALALTTAIPTTRVASAQDASATIARVKLSVVAVGTFERTRSPSFQFRGTGFVVDDGTLVVTNAHVMPPALDGDRLEQVAILVPQHTGTKATFREARMIAMDTSTDLALLRIGGAPREGGHLLAEGTLAGREIRVAAQALLPDRLRLRGQQVALGETHLTRELVGPCADDQDVGQLLHHLAGDLDRVLDAVDGPDAAGGQRLAVHQRGVEFDLAHQVRQPGVPDAVVVRVALHRLDPGDHRVDRAAALAQHLDGLPDPDIPIATRDDNHALPPGQQP